LKHFAVVTAFVALLAGIVVMPGSGASFVDYTPCPADGPLLVCPAGQVGHPYNLQLQAYGGCDLYRWETPNGSVPVGLKMASSGLVSGIPTQTGKWTPWVVVHDLTQEEGGYSWCGGDNKSERQFVFTVVPGLDIQDQTVPGATIGQAYSKTLTVFSLTNTNPRQGSATTANWSVASGNLPAGITLAGNGVLSGTPTTEGVYTFVVKASGGGGATDTETYTIAVRQPLALNAAIGKAEIDAPFTATPTATGGDGNYTWSVTKGALPAGLTIAANGAISGSPTAAGRYPFTLTVADHESRSKSVDVVLVVAQKLAFKTLALKAAKLGAPYRMRVATTGGVRPLTWEIAGKLPRGLRFSTKTGTFTGVARTAGKFRLTFTVTDALSVTAKKTLTLSVGNTTAKRRHSAKRHSARR
jgi:large repetitive protein